jgi:dihydroorotate dehydrogenase
MSTAYERFVRPILFAIDPETAHHGAIACLGAASRSRGALRALSAFRPTDRPKTVFGLHFRNPIGLAAGLDKNGVAIPAWAALGFGLVEIGTVTAKAQPGNPRPRIFRFPEQHALINRLGFNNDGADVIARRIAYWRGSKFWPGECRVGINIGKSRGTPLEQAIDDYLYSFRRLEPVADYIVINVSSPNTPGLRDLQSAGQLSHLLGALRGENCSKPLLVKIAPDLSTGELEDVIRISEHHQISGIIATNTTLDHSAIAASVDQAGGLSGTPLRTKSTEFVRAIRAKSRIPLIASGGILDAPSAREKFEAGAQLIQLYTGLIYRGPGLLREIARAL